MMLKMQDGALKLCDSFLENPENLNTTLCFYASQLDIGAARLMHGGKQPTHPAQMNLLISAITYAREVEEAFEAIADGDD